MIGCNVISRFQVLFLKKDNHILGFKSQSCDYLSKIFVNLFLTLLMMLPHVLHLKYILFSDFIVINSGYPHILHNMYSSIK